MNAPDIKDWIGRSTIETDIASLAPIRGLASLLDRDPADVRQGDAIAASSLWLYFLPHIRQSEIDRDGHPRKGGFLPPVSLPRRMWAGSSMEIGEAVRIGDAIERKSTISAVSEKSGRSGHLVFVTVEHEVYGPRGMALLERQDIVYREPAPAATATAVPAQAVDIPRFDATRVFQPDPVRLFRFSALTFNGHRIHYDRDYARGEEGYRDLVVHGPLVATLLLDLAREVAGDLSISGFVWRGKQPTFADAPLTLGARRIGSDQLELAAVGPDGITMEAQATTAAAAA